MKLKVIFTGGTIGSNFDGDYISPEKSTRYTLLENYREQYGDSVTFETEVPYTLLSENLSAVHLTRLLKCVEQSLSQSFDGIIVTHGTDTLQYSAAAIGYAFADCKVPVVLVSSNYTLTDSRSNGQENFNSAVSFISQQIPGVFVSYKSNELTDIHCATRVMRHAEYTDAVESVGGAAIGFVDGGIFRLNNDFKQLAANNSAFGALDMTKAKVLFITAHVGMSYPQLSSSIGAVLISSYHSGTIATDGKDLEQFCDEASKMGIPVFLTGAVAGKQYESTSKFKELGITVLPKMSAVAAYIKLWLSCCETNSAEQIRQRMLKPVGNDLPIDEGGY